MAVPKNELIDSHVSLNTAQTAVDAILKHAKKQHELEEETEILGANEQRISLSVGKKKIRDIVRTDPRVIPLAHPIVDPRKTSICLIVKDPQREYKDLLEKEKIKFIGRVVGVSKLKGKFRGFEERRQLLTAHGLFLVDDRVAALMPKLLGSMWFKAKKQPLPVNMAAKDLKSHLERAISNTFMNENKGHTVSVKVGHTLQSPKHVLDNISAALPAIVKHIDGGWNNVQNVYLTVPGSSGKPGVSLPLWTCDLGAGEGGRWDVGLSKPVAEEWGGLGGDDDDEASEMDEEIPPPKRKRNLKQSIELSDEGSAPPKKKVAKTSSAVKSTRPESVSSKSTSTLKSPSKPKESGTPSAKREVEISAAQTLAKSKATKNDDLSSKKKQSALGTKPSKSSAKLITGTRKSKPLRK